MPKFALVIHRLPHEPQRIELSANEVARITMLIEDRLKELKEKAPQYRDMGDYEALLEKLRRCF